MGFESLPGNPWILIKGLQTGLLGGRTTGVRVISGL